MAILIAHKAEVLGLLLAISEVLALIPSVKANGVIDLVIAGLKKLQ